MSCPSWSRLVAHRFAGADQQEPDGWREALEHLGSCAACREAAYAADPTLVLLRHGDAELDGDEVSRMRAGVDSLRRARRVEEHSPEQRSPRGRGADRSRSVWSALVPSAMRLAAAAGLAGVLLSVYPHREPPAATAALPEIQAFAPSASIDSWGSDMAATDDFFLSTATVYHFDEDDLNVVILVDSGLDV